MHMWYQTPETIVYTPDVSTISEVYVTRSYCMLNPNHWLGIITIQDVEDNYLDTRFFNLPAVHTVISNEELVEATVVTEIDWLLEDAWFVEIV